MNLKRGLDQLISKLLKRVNPEKIRTTIASGLQELNSERFELLQPWNQRKLVSETCEQFGIPTPEKYMATERELRKYISRNVDPNYKHIEANYEL